MFPPTLRRMMALSPILQKSKCLPYSFFPHNMKWVPLTIRSPYPSPSFAPD